MNRFFRYQLRTTNVEAARAFYKSVLGHDDPTIVPLHEQAVARGAPAHWCGFVNVGTRDVELAAAEFAERGAVALAPKWINPEGLEAAVMKDPGGAVLALAKPPRHGSGRPAHDVEWHILNTPDVERAKQNYAALFGWHFDKPIELEDGAVLHPFAWQPSDAAVGAFYDIAARPGVHPHWLFHFAVESLEQALAAVKRGGGVAIDPISLPNGDYVAVCDDPQGAAFALWESPPGAAQ
jgi:predicted enzyme related to lactoylglutathione lyase